MRELLSFLPNARLVDVPRYLTGKVTPELPPRYLGTQVNSMGDHLVTLLPTFVPRPQISDHHLRPRHTLRFSLPLLCVLHFKLPNDMSFPLHSNLIHSYIASLGPSSSISTRFGRNSSISISSNRSFRLRNCRVCPARSFEYLCRVETTWGR